MLFFIGLCWDTVDMSIYLPSNKCLEIQQLGHSLLQSEPVTVCQVWSPFGMTNFLSLNIHNFSTHWMYIILHLTYFVFHFSSASTSENVSVATESSSLAISYSWWGNYYGSTHNHWTSYFQGFCGTWSDFMHKAHIGLQELNTAVPMIHKMAFSFTW